MPFVLDGESGRVEVVARGTRHAITMTVNRIRQEPVIDHRTAPDPAGQAGTSVRVFWPDSARSILADARPRFLQIAADHPLLNPHLTLGVNWQGADRVRYPAAEAS